MEKPQEHRAGTVALVGLPNAGKSTLMNQILEQKVSIVSSKPQTTRNRILGILTQSGLQIAFVDTPGIHQPKGRLHRIMVRAAEEVIPEVDVVCWVVDAVALTRKRGKGNEIIYGGTKHLCNLLKNQANLLVLLNKIDLVKKSNLLPVFAAFGQELPKAEIFPLSAKNGDNCDTLIEVIKGLLPVSPPLFPSHYITDVSERFLVAEMIREKIFALTNQEIPYSIAVEIEQFVERESEDETTPKGAKEQSSESQEIASEAANSEQVDLSNADLVEQFLSAPELTQEKKRGVIEIFARIWVERSSQKGIIIGKQGAKLKEIMSRARIDIERLLGTRVWIDAHVSVLERWSDDPRRLKQLGYE